MHSHVSMIYLYDSLIPKPPREPGYEATCTQAPKRAWVRGYLCPGPQESLGTRLLVPRPPREPGYKATFMCACVALVVTMEFTPSASTVFPLSRGTSQSKRVGTRPSNTSPFTAISGNSPVESTGTVTV